MNFGGIYSFLVILQTCHVNTNQISPSIFRYVLGCVVLLELGCFGQTLIVYFLKVQWLCLVWACLVSALAYPCLSLKPLA